MALHLRIVSDHRRSLGDRSSIVFGVGGGTIGRSADNDWVLPDPLRYVSAHHARVSFRQGHYFLEDLSTNGAFVNDGDVSIAKVGPHKLQSGDLLRFGDYQVSVAVEAEAPAESVAAAPSPDAVAVPTSIHGLRTIGRAAQTDIGASLDLGKLLIPDPTPESAPARVAASALPEVATGQASSPQSLLGNQGFGPAAGQTQPGDSANQSGGFRPSNAWGQAVARIPRPAESALEQEPDEEVIARRIARLARAASKDPRNPLPTGGGASAPALFDVQSGLQAFCRGAGIDAEKLPADAQTRLMHLVGQLFREAFVGLKDLERSRNEIRNRYRIEVQQDPDDPRPSLARMAVEDLLIEILHQHETRRLDAVQWLREQMTTSKDHENAVSQAMQEAFVEFVGRLDPAELEARFERAARRGKLRSGGKAQAWELYADFYRNLVEKPAEHMPHTFVEAFSIAYREFIKKKPG
jgi:type VI secretion system FHA domain protein